MENLQVKSSNPYLAYVPTYADIPHANPFRNQPDYDTTNFGETETPSQKKERKTVVIATLIAAVSTLALLIASRGKISKAAEAITKASETAETGAKKVVETFTQSTSPVAEATAQSTPTATRAIEAAKGEVTAQPQPARTVIEPMARPEPPTPQVEPIEPVATAPSETIVPPPRTTPSTPPEPTAPPPVVTEPIIEEPREAEALLPSRTVKPTKPKKSVWRRLSGLFKKPSKSTARGKREPKPSITELIDPLRDSRQRTPELDSPKGIAAAEIAKRQSACRQTARAKLIEHYRADSNCRQLVEQLESGEISNQMVYLKWFRILLDKISEESASKIVLGRSPHEINALLRRARYQDIIIIQSLKPDITERFVTGSHKIKMSPEQIQALEEMLRQLEAAG
ncbi:MAG: hypothetical protein PHC64_07120 [Candidatus Gastranaerophilales bacterium]|nr:hypothetical protein [Candidatus Gastranaerophilales bacterium]